MIVLWGFSLLTCCTYLAFLPSLKKRAGGDFTFACEANNINDKKLTASGNM